MIHDTRQPHTTPDPNLVLFLRALVLLALIAACVYGGLSEAILALMLRHLPQPSADMVRTDAHLSIYIGT